MYNLSNRLCLIASLVSKGARICDVGTDHGYLPIYLMHSSKAKSVIATDIREKPLENAQKNVKLSGVKGIELRLCDGLSAVKNGEVDTVIIAGMGGEVISAIISRCDWIKNKDISLILQPMTSAEELRKYLYNNGFEIIDEPTVLDNNKVYSVMSVKYTGVKAQKPQYFYYMGKISAQDEIGKAYITKQLKRCRDCANSLKNVSGKENEYEHYLKTAENLEEILNGF